jgi:outer membrane lipoprotein SlyB
MKAKAMISGVLVTLVCMSSQSYAAGCMKGAAVGGAGGHFVGSGHAVAGAAGGCVVGHHEASKKAKEDTSKAQTQKGAAQQPQS